MEIKHAIKKQYQATLNMLKQAIEVCPDTLWNDLSFTNKFWHISFHTLYFTDVYTQGTDTNFVKWEKHKDGFEFLDRLPEQDEIPIEDAYNKEEIMEYYNHIMSQIDARIDATVMEIESEVSWIPFTSFEFGTLK